MKLDMININKSFGPVQVLTDVSLHVLPGEIHALIGENGAGKSTLMKILTGIYRKDSGNICIDDVPVDFHTIRDSEAIGIAIVNQELNVFEEMTVLENLFMTKEIVKKGVIDEKSQIIEATKVLKRLGIEIDLKQKAKELSVGMQQMIEIAKSLIIDAELIVMDEPTSALTGKEITTLFRVIKLLRSEGKSIIYISHRMKEIFELCDRMTILKDGRFIISEEVKNISFDDVVKNMVGYDLGGLFPEKPSVEIGETILEVKNLTKDKQFQNINFTVREGEIVGFAGLMGSGRTEIMNVLFGVVPKDQGDIFIRSQLANISSPRDAKAHGIGYVTENRKEEGLFLDFSIKENILYNILNRVKNKTVINERKINNIASDYLSQVNLKYRDFNQLAEELSGGNQQKVVLAKWLANHPSILILDEPTRGIDVNSKKQIYELIYKLKELKIGIIVVSSELVEILGIADKICVMREGSLMATLDNENLTDESVMKYMMGGSVK